MLISFDFGLLNSCTMYIHIKFKYTRMVYKSTVTRNYECSSGDVQIEPVRKMVQIIKYCNKCIYMYSGACSIQISACMDCGNMGGSGVCAVLL